MFDLTLFWVMNMIILAAAYLQTEPTDRFAVIARTLIAAQFFNIVILLTPYFTTLMLIFGLVIWTHCAITRRNDDTLGSFLALRYELLRSSETLVLVCLTASVCTFFTSV